MTQAELSLRTGLSTKHINQIVQGVAPLSHATAISLERATGVPARMWNNLESNYRESLERSNDRVALEDSREWLSKMPIGFLRKRGIVTASQNDCASIVQQVLAFFGVASREAWENTWRDPIANFRKSSVFETDVAALATWLRMGELAAANVDCSQFNRDKLRNSIPGLRSLTVRPVNDALAEARNTCAAAGVAVVIVPEISGCRASGATRWIYGSMAILQLSVRYKRDDHLWFSFFHELGHILLHGKRESFLEAGNEQGADCIEQSKEEEADRFATETLIPNRYTSELFQLKSLVSVQAFAAKVGVSPGIVVGRLQHEGLVDYRFGHQLLVRFSLSE